MGPRTLVLGTVGALSTAFGVGLLLAPDTLRSVPPVDGLAATTTVIGPTTVGALVGALVVISLLVTARSPGHGDQTTDSDVPRFERATTAPPEEVVTHTQAVTGESVEADIRTTIERGDATEEVRRLLAETAASVYAARTDCTRSTATDVVERGQWTDDEVAAVFLAGADGPDTSVGMQLRLWFTPERERSRRIERTVSAIETISQETTVEHASQDGVEERRTQDSAVERGVQG